jgi:hypothetical protein
LLLARFCLRRPYVSSAVSAGGGLCETARHWQCINPKGVNVRQGPRQSFPIARTIGFNESIEVDEVKTNGDVETIKGDNRWLHVPEGFAWAGNFRRS